jgi:hypothetical protein
MFRIASFETVDRKSQIETYTTSKPWFGEGQAFKADMKALLEVCG